MLMEFVLFFKAYWLFFLIPWFFVSIILAMSWAERGSPGWRFLGGVAFIVSFVVIMGTPFAANSLKDFTLANCYEDQQTLAKVAVSCQGEIVVENERVESEPINWFDPINYEVTYSDTATDVTYHHTYADLVVGRHREESVLIKTTITAPTRRQCDWSDVDTDVVSNEASGTMMAHIEIDADETCTVDIPEEVKIPLPLDNVQWDLSSSNSSARVDSETGKLVVPVYSTDIAMIVPLKKVSE